MKQISKVSPYGKGYNSHVDQSVRLAFEIDSSNVISTMPDNLNVLLSSLVTCDLGLSPDLMNIETKLSHLILFETGGHFKRILHSEKHFGRTYSNFLNEYLDSFF